MGPMKPARRGRRTRTGGRSRTMGNDFLMDREVQRTMNFTGIPTVRLQDAAVITSMGGDLRPHPRAPRHDGRDGDRDTPQADQGRQGAARRRASCRRPRRTPEAYRKRSCSAILPGGVDWQEALATGTSPARRSCRRKRYRKRPRSRSVRRGPRAAVAGRAGRCTLRGSRRRRRARGCGGCPGVAS